MTESVERSVDRSVERVGRPTVSGSVHRSVKRSYVRTYGRTNGEPWSPSRDISPLVTRTRAYDDDPDVTLAEELAAKQRAINERGARLVREALHAAKETKP